MTIGLDPTTGRLVTGVIRFPNFLQSGSVYTDPNVQKTHDAWGEWKKQKKENVNFDPKLTLPIPFDKNAPLLVHPPSKPSNICRNMAPREYYFPHAINPANAAEHSARPVLNILAGICKGAEVYVCDNEECVRNREHLDNIIPACDWSPFREWMIQAITCQRSLDPAERVSSGFFHLASALGSFYWVFDMIKRNPEFSSTITGTFESTNDSIDSLDLFSVCEFIHWGLLVQENIGTESVLFEAWGQAMIPHRVAAKPISDALRRATEHENVICPNRLWSLSFISERGEHDLPMILELAGQHPQLEHVGHRSCTSGVCAYTSVDATRIKQLHRCEIETRGDCRASKLHFDPVLLKVSMETGGGTAWSIDAPYEVSSKPYVAISHVWSDGTGIGLDAPGLVNRCLFKYMADIVRSLGCGAIWWDTISIPTDPRSRVKLINEMHANYSGAEYVLLHDDYLANVEWADDGSPCLAVVLSPWFTRGWTALEAAMAKRIKVIFKKPGSSELVVKDLDDEVLAKDPSGCHPAHWIASTMIRRLRRGDNIENVGDLLAILKPRHTSWPRDRMIIAGLLAGVQVDYNMSAATITKQIFQKFKKVNLTSLMHGETTISESGGWSWCPSYIYDLKPAPPSEFEQGSTLFLQDSLFVDPEGTLGGHTWARKVKREDTWERRIVPFSTHPSVIFKIKTALTEWNDCFLLGMDPGPFILVKVEARNESRLFRHFNGFLGCTFVGVVHAIGEPGLFQSVEGGQSELRDVMIGREPKSYTETITYVYHSEFGAEVSSIEATGFLGGCIWVGDQYFRGELLVSQHRDIRCQQQNTESNFARPGYLLHRMKVQQTPEDSAVGVVANLEPHLGVSDDGVVTDISGTLLSDNLAYSTVKPTNTWPPKSIPESTRVGSFSSELIDAMFSREFFRIETENAILTYFALRSDLLDPSEELPFKGLWACFWSDDEFEFHLFQQPNENQVNGVKLTSIQDKRPRGYTNMKMFQMREASTSNIQMPQEFPRLVQGELALWGHRDPPKSETKTHDVKTWTQAQFKIINKDAIDLISDSEEGVYLKYRRIAHKELLSDS